MAATISSKEITDFMSHDVRILDYFNMILSYFNTFGLESSYGDWVCFGGFVRDIIEGIPYEKLILKDIDFCFIYKDKIPRTDRHKLVQEKIDVLLSNKEIKVEYYNKQCGHNKFKVSYSMAKIVYKGIPFDICFECNKSRFNLNYDFNCNALYFHLDDKILRNRIINDSLNTQMMVTVDDCINDIKAKRLTTLLSSTKPEYLKYKYIRRVPIRMNKMASYGYSINPEDVKIITQSRNEYIRELMTEYRKQTEGLAELLTTINAYVGKLTYISDKRSQYTKSTKDYVKYRHQIDKLQAKEDKILVVLASTKESADIYQANIDYLARKLANVGRGLS